MQLLTERVLTVGIIAVNADVAVIGHLSFERDSEENQILGRGTQMPETVRVMVPAGRRIAMRQMNAEMSRAASHDQAGGLLCVRL